MRLGTLPLARSSVTIRNAVAPLMAEADGKCSECGDPLMGDRKAVYYVK